MDTRALKADYDRNQAELRILEGKERQLNSSFNSKKSQVSKYKSDADRAALTAKKYAEDLERAEAESTKIETELKEVRSKIQENTLNIQKLKRELDEMTREIERTMRNATNTNGVPQKQSNSRW